VNEILFRIVCAVRRIPMPLAIAAIALVLLTWR
jgi:hypothetical protein